MNIPRFLTWLREEFGSTRQQGRPKQPATGSTQSSPVTALGKKNGSTPGLYIVHVPELRTLVTDYFQVVATELAQAPPKVKCIMQSICEDAAQPNLNEAWVALAQEMANKGKGARVNVVKSITGKTYLLSAINVSPEEIVAFFRPRGYQAHFFEHARQHMSGLFVHIVAIPIHPHYADWIVFVSFGDPGQDLVVLAAHLTE